MTYVVLQACIGCKDTACATVCPVECFVDVGHMLVIDPDTCIDCGVCQPECPVDAIASDSDNVPDLAHWISENARLAKP